MGENVLQRLDNTINWLGLAFIYFVHTEASTLSQSSQASRLWRTEGG